MPFGTGKARQARLHGVDFPLNPAQNVFQFRNPGIRVAGFALGSLELLLQLFAGRLRRRRARFHFGFKLFTVGLGLPHFTAQQLSPSDLGRGIHQPHRRRRQGNQQSEKQNPSGTAFAQSALEKRLFQSSIGGRNLRHVREWEKPR